MPATDIRTQSGHFNGADIQVTGASASVDLRLKAPAMTIPTIPTAAGTVEVLVIAVATGTVTSLRVAFKEALATDNTNFVTFRFINKSAADADIIAATDANTTKTTGGAAIAAYTSRLLTLGTAVGVTKGDVLALRITGAGTLANTLTQGTAQPHIAALL